MEDKENKRKLLSCMMKGPGPVYKLRTLVGYDEHCPSKHRSPAFSIRPRTQIRVPSIGPGPRYDIARFTNYGLDNPPAYTITKREPFRIRDLGPGPGAHSPELCPPMNHNLRPPMYSIKSRSTMKIQDEGPGPNAYNLPTCIGPKIPDKLALGAFSIGSYHKSRQELLGPGPAAYSNIKSDLIKRSSPAYSLKWRHQMAQIQRSPGPKYDSRVNILKRPPMYSFGIRHSECTGVPITSVDED